MKTLEERAFERKIHYRDTIYGLLRSKERRIYSDAANEQKELTLKAFDEWLCRNSWITRDENNRQALSDLRSIIMSL